jgi:hypothetical protein
MFDNEALKTINRLCGCIARAYGPKEHYSYRYSLSSLERRAWVEFHFQLIGPQTSGPIIADTWHSPATAITGLKSILSEITAKNNRKKNY